MRRRERPDQINMHVIESSLRDSKFLQRSNNVTMNFRSLAQHARIGPIAHVFSHALPNEFVTHQALRCFYAWVG